MSISSITLSLLFLFVWLATYSALEVIQGETIGEYASPKSPENRRDVDIYLTNHWYCINNYYCKI